MKTLSVNLLIA